MHVVNPTQYFDIKKEDRSRLKCQNPRLIWLTGISGSGKSTIANSLDKELYSLGRHSYVLDGDNIRNGLCKDLGFSNEDRKENVRRVAEVAKLMLDSGLIVIAAFISPFKEDRQMAKSIFDNDEFLEVFVDTPFEVAEERDAKGFYKKARRGEISHFTGMNSDYEQPDNADIILDGTSPLSESVERILLSLELEKDA